MFGFADYAGLIFCSGCTLSSMLVLAVIVQFVGRRMFHIHLYIQSVKLDVGVFVMRRPCIQYCLKTIRDALGARLQTWERLVV